MVLYDVHFSHYTFSPDMGNKTKQEHLGKIPFMFKKAAARKQK